MPDLRYHVISLISVFLALAIGVLLGIAMADRNIITDQLRSEVTGIQEQLDEQQELIAERNQEISEQERSLDEMSQMMLSDRLQDVDVAMVLGPWADDGVADEVQNAVFNEAGANLASRKRLPTPDPSESTTPGELDPETIYTNEAFDTLGNASAETPEVIIYVGGGEPPPDISESSVETLEIAQRAMFEVWQEAGVRIIAAEPTETGRSEISLFQDMGVTTSVDNVDTALGRTALVELADNFEEGSYGTKSTASSLFPSAPG